MLNHHLRSRIRLTTPQIKLFVEHTTFIGSPTVYLLYEGSMTAIYGVLSGFLLFFLSLVSLYIILSFHISFTGKIHHFFSLLL